MNSSNIVFTVYTGVAIKASLTYIHLLILTPDTAKKALEYTITQQF